MNVKQTFEATVSYNNHNKRHYAHIESDRSTWAITPEDEQLFGINDSLTVVVSIPHNQDQFCKVEYVVPAADVFNRQFEEWKGDGKDNGID